MNTFSKMWNIKTPAEAKEMIAKQVAETGSQSRRIWKSRDCPSWEKMYSRNL